MMLLMPLYTVADAPLCCLEVLLTGKADTPYRVKALFPQGFYPILTIVRLYSNNRSPILKRSFAYRQTIGLKFSRGSMGGSKGAAKLTYTAPAISFCFSYLITKGAAGVVKTCFELFRCAVQNHQTGCCKGRTVTATR